MIMAEHRIGNISGKSMKYNEYRPWQISLYATTYPSQGDILTCINMAAIRTKSHIKNTDLSNKE